MICEFFLGKKKIHKSVEKNNTSKIHKLHIIKLLLDLFLLISAFCRIGGLQTFSGEKNTSKSGDKQTKIHSNQLLSGVKTFPGEKIRYL